jgi:hypothetical protein
LWSALRSRSIENASRFSWRENAGRVASVYQEVVESTAANRRSSLPPKASGAIVLEGSGQLREERTIALGHGE